MPRTHANNPAPAAVRTVSFVSLGCPKNLVDSEKMLGLLAEDGIMPVAWDACGDDHACEGEGGHEGAHVPRADQAHRAPHRVDAIVINTCGFLDASKEESLQVIRDAIDRKRRGEVRRVVVAGCLVQRHRAKMLEWAPGIDAMIGVFDRDHIIEAVKGEGARTADDRPGDEKSPPYWITANALVAARDRGLRTAGLTVNGKDGKGVGYFEDDSARLRLTPRHYAYLRISEGCNQNCAFCTIPSIRGKMRSKPLDRIHAEALELIADGAFEINLIGQDTTSYGDDIGIGFRSPADESGMKRGASARRDPPTTGLPAAIAAVNRAFDESGAPCGMTGGWIRLMYAYPSNFSDGIIDALAELCANGRLLPYIDMPLQHASDRMLELMRRNVTAEQQRRLILKLRERIPGIAIRTTFITGFPGETEDDHEQLLDFVGELAFDALGVFEYSREEGTRAGSMDLDPALHVPPEVKAERRDEIMRLQQEIAFEQAKFLADQFNEADPVNSGCQFDVLIDKPLTSRLRDTPGVSGVKGGEGTLHKGRAYFQAPDIDALTYVFSRERLAPGELVRCTIVGADGYDLIARPVSELTRRVPLPVTR